MLRKTYVEQFEFNYILVNDPFNLDELYRLVSSIPVDPIPHEATKPVLMDLREVDLGQISEVEIRRHFMRKSTLDKRVTGIPCAYVVKDLKDYSAMRLASIFGDLSGVGAEYQTLVTENLFEAVAWLEGLTGRAGADIPALLDEEKLIASTTAVYF